MSTSKETSLPEYLVIDGGLGSEIKSRLGLHLKDPLWTTRAHATNKDTVMEIHREYLEAGADIIITNTYKPLVQCVAKELGLDPEAARDFFRSLARDTCALRDQFWQSAKHKYPDRVRPLVAGSMGPYATSILGASDYLGAYVDNVSVEEMTNTFREKAHLLLEGGVDILAFETIPAQKEAEAICKLMKEIPNARAWVVYCCKDGDHVGHGEMIQDAVMTSLQSDQVIGVGVNCTKPQYVTSLLKQIPDVVKERKKIVVYPNSGREYNLDTRLWEGDSDTRSIHEYISDWLKAGANWIGGCCYVTPADIMPFRGEIDTFLKNNRS